MLAYRLRSKGEVRRNARAIVVLALLMGGPLLRAEIRETIHRAFGVGEAPRVVVTHVSGAILVRGTDVPNLQVDAIKRTSAPDSRPARERLNLVRLDIQAEVGSASIATRYGDVLDWEKLKELAKKPGPNDVQVDLEIEIGRASCRERV